MQPQFAACNFSVKHDVAAFIGMGYRYGDLHVTAKVVQESHQAVGGKTVKPSVDNLGNLGLVNAE